jgi:glycosyltransferase involved in cell wall biosynthesis
MDKYYDAVPKETDPAEDARNESGEIERLITAIIHSWEGNPGCVRKVQQQILPWFYNCTHVLDVCCGQGIFLESLRNAGIAGEGIEGDPNQVQKAREQGLRVHQGIVPEGLKSILGSFDGIFLGHIIEHFSGQEATALLYYCLQLLMEGGVIAIQTPNTAHPNINSQFWLDITHVRPYPQKLLETMLTCLDCDILCSSPLSNSADGNLDMLVVGQKRVLTPAQKTGLIWAGLLFSSSGYGHEIRSFVGNLDRKNFDLKVISLGYDEKDLINPEEQAKLNVLGQIPVDPARAIVIYHWPPETGRQDIRGRVNITRTMFETTGIPANWVQPLSQLDEIWVPSSFNQDTFSACGVPRHKLRVVPSGVDTDFFHPDAHPLDLGLEKGFTFLSNFVFADRKGWDLLLTAYLTEFRPDEDVSLLIKTYGDARIIGERVWRFTQERFFQKQLPHFKMLVDRLHSSKLPGLYTACNAFVLPSRGEGWGLPYIEAMACGLPTIGTKWSGNLEYMNEENSYLIEIEGLEDIPKHIDTPILIGYQWAKPSVDHLRQQMRRVFDHRREAAAKGETARAEICRKWTFKHAAELARQELLKYCNI